MEGNKIHIVTAKEKYNQELLSTSWQHKRTQILKRDEHQCQCCSATENLQVHHKQYHVNKHDGRWNSPWAYEDKYLITLCESCHQQGHSLYQIPVFKL